VTNTRKTTFEIRSEYTDAASKQREREREREREYDGILKRKRMNVDEKGQM